MENRRVVITGIGVIAPNGIGREQFWNACLAGNAVSEPIPDSWKQWTSTASSLWSPLPPIDFRDYALDRVELIQMDMCARLACASTNMALHDAGYELVPKSGKNNNFTITGVDPDRCGVLWGTGAGGVSTLIDNFCTHISLPVKERLDSLNVTHDDERLLEIRNLLESGTRMNPFAVPMFMPNSCSARIGIKYSLYGANSTVNAACAAGTVSIGQAYSAIKNGSFDCAITGGSEFIGDRYGSIFRCFDIPGVLVKNCSDPATANRPFDKNRSGFLYAEGGSATLILENLTHALERKAPIIAEIVSFAETFDAHSIMMIEPSGEHIRRMISTALDNAGLQPSDIDYINGHGTGTELNDDIEAGIILDMFGTKPLVNSTKSLIGHTIGASGAIEAVVTALSIVHDTTHISINIDDPVNELTYVRKPVSRPLQAALTHSFAFGGHNAGLVMRKYEA